MASRKEQKKSSSRRHRDRISGLTDDVLGHVLSFLPTKEAARAAALSRRWRHVFGSVHTISFEETKGERAYDWYTYYVQALERKSCSTKLLDDVNAALLCHRRCAGLPVPPRSLRFAFDKWHWWDKVAVDQWLSYVAPRRHVGHLAELHLDMCFYLGPVCTASDSDSDGTDDDDDDDSGGAGSDSDEETKWSCRFKLGRTTLTIDLPVLETMRLTALGDSGESIQCLISSCPRLADLTLEALWNLKRISVLDKRLRRFSIRCCHDLKSAIIDAAELKLLDYRGMVPAGSLLSLHRLPAIIPSCTIDFCRPLSKEAQFVRFRDFLDKIQGVAHLRLHHQSLESKFFGVAGFPLFSSLTRLTLQGCIQTHHSVDALRMVLEQTPNLEVLTLLMERSKEEYGDINVPASILSIPCLRHRVREIAMENYEGLKPEKSLAKLLLQNALVLERLHVVFAKEIKPERKNILEAEIGKWGVANSEDIFV
ncbi:hypothetical protein CFC21_025768 [Triticum aestivum]|uniref:F-box domain-containing protein n=3 Tax=Triticum TaxID=4564 RepID=A0A9R1PZE4_TRITD|nr:hypothetical protein CFC21_025768 [Triticum aestivum]VAH52580.1 unnamed protein product [Triticum turgidum subsp. durum]